MEERKSWESCPSRGESAGAVRARAVEVRDFLLFSSLSLSLVFPLCLLFSSPALSFFQILFLLGYCRRLILHFTQKVVFSVCHRQTDRLRHLL